MKDRDALERVFQGLREIAASDGLEQRVLRGAVSRVQIRQRRRWMGRILVATVMVSGILFGVRHESGGRSASLAGKTAARASSRVELKPGPVQHKDASNGVHAVLGVRRAVGRRVLREGSSPVTLEASFPAPPLPLTEQERWLQVIARRGQTQEVAIVPVSKLVPEDAQYVAQIKEYEEFFYVPPWVEPVEATFAPATINAAQPGKSMGGK